MRNLTIFPAVIALLGLVICCASDCRAQLFLTDLGADFRPKAIDDQGWIAGQRLSTGKAVLWNGSELVNVGPAGSALSVGNAIYNGEVVGSAQPVIGFGAFHYSNGTTLILPTPFVGVPIMGVDINAAGQKLGNITIGSFKLIAVWDAGNNFGTALSGDTTAQAFAFNDMGDGVGMRLGNGFYWRGINPSVPARTFDSFMPHGINNNRLIGGVVGNATAGLFQVGESANPTAIPNIGLLGTSSQVTGINNADELVGKTNSTVFYYNHDLGELVNLNAQPFQGAAFTTLLTVTGISDDGQIIGTGLVGGVEHAFVAQFNELDPVVAGDYDGNGIVEPADYDVWKASFGMTVTPPGSGADGNGNGVVDAADYTVWRNNLSAAMGGGAVGIESAQTAVPEPQSLGLALLACCGLFSRAPSRTKRSPA